MFKLTGKLKLRPIKNIRTPQQDRDYIPIADHAL
jgi:hypothetical protein